MSNVSRSGKVAGAGGKAQHVELHRKLALRRALLPLADPVGACYVPFIGDGDIAVECYQGRRVFGADLDPARVATAASRLKGSDVRVFDCNAWPFPDIDQPFAIADLDAYANPYQPLVSFWANATRARRIVIFGTDGMRHAVAASRLSQLIELPSGKGTREGVTLNQVRHQYNFWWQRTAYPFIEQTLAPWRIVRSQFYIRKGMLYWGVVTQP